MYPAHLQINSGLLSRRGHGHPRHLNSTARLSFHSIGDHLSLSTNFDFRSKNLTPWPYPLFVAIPIPDGQIRRKL
jgi:hypothetical protein